MNEVWEVKKWVSDGEYSSLHPLKKFQNKNAMLDWIRNQRDFSYEKHKIYHNGADYNVPRVMRVVLEHERIEKPSTSMEHTLPPLKNYTGRWLDYNPPGY
jgi:hypothetical protein